MTVHCPDLKATRPRYLNQQMDRWLRANYFKGLSLSMLAEDFRAKFAPGSRSWMHSGYMVERILANRLSDLGLRRRM